MLRRRLMIVMVMFLAVMALPGMALAQPPANDNFEGSVVIDPGELPFEATVDTTEATNEGADLEAGDLCEGPPATDAGVWYSITPTEDVLLFVDTEGTDYPAGIIVLTGEPGSFGFDGCSPGDFIFFAAAGVTHHLFIIDDQGDGGGNGGTLELYVAEAGEELCPGIFTGTFRDANVIIGTDGDDVLTGTPARDVIVGLDGDDTIMGRGGDDSIAGCGGDDVIHAGHGDDEVTGDDLGFFGNPEAEGGNDTIKGGPGDDGLFGGPGDDVMKGGPGNDGVVGHQGNDRVYGNAGDDGVLGGFGDDYVSGGNGKDFVSGGWGNDHLLGGNGKDFLNGAPPAFEEFDPEPEATDTCDGGNGKDVQINCEA